MLNLFQYLTFMMRGNSKTLKQVQGDDGVIYMDFIERTIGRLGRPYRHASGRNIVAANRILHCLSCWQIVR